MELITYNAQTSRAKTGDPMIRFSRGGVIALNRPAAEALKLKAGDQIVLHQDKQRKKDWYLEKVNAGGFVLRSSADKRTLLFNCVKLSVDVIVSLGEEKAVKVPISCQVHDGKYYALLTSAVK